MSHTLLSRSLCLLGLMFGALASHAAVPKADVPGSRDHPVLQRLSLIHI